VSKARARTKEARDIERAVRRAGGTVERTGKGHLRVVGPDGFAIVGSAPGANRLAKAYETIRAKTGLDLT
jgi:sarcosine oxidase gamma subunit